jgi:hypothetical protein
MEENLLTYNRETLYILINGEYKAVKNTFTKINDCKVNIGRGDSQKANNISPLDFRLSCYLMAMFNFDYKYISYLNAFKDLSEDRYLPF